MIKILSTERCHTSEKLKSKSKIISYLVHLQRERERERKRERESEKEREGKDFNQEFV